MKGKNPHIMQIGVILFVVMILFYNAKGGFAPQTSHNNIIKSITVPYSEMITQVKSGNVSQVSVNEDEKQAEALLNNGKEIKSSIPQNYELLNKEIIENNVDLKISPKEQPSFLWGMFTIFGPILLLIAFYVFMVRRNNPGSPSNSMNNFGKTKATLSNPEDNKVRFSDVAGCDEAKLEVAEIVDFLKTPDRFLKIGAKIPKGVIMSGPPGTGKTLLAKAIAGEAGVPFFSLSGSDFIEMFAGVGASRVRDLFEQAKKVSPCIIFIDEIDAVGKRRSNGAYNNDEREQTLNALLTQMDGFDTSTNIIVIAATNRKDVLDPALIRPGRFDREVAVSLPDILGREKILSVHTKTVKLDAEVSLTHIARGTNGFSGAELSNLVNEAALIAARKNQAKITQNDFEMAKDKLIMGYERKSYIMPEKERISTAWHEAGHAVVARFSPHADPLHKVTIIPRGNALGVTMQLPAEDRYGYTEEELLTMISVLYAGRLAEQIFLGEMGTGASNDIERATNIAKNMVVRFGMSKLGPIHFGVAQGTGFKGDTGGGSNEMSQDSHNKIDEEVKRILMSQYKQAKNILDSKKLEMKLLAEALLEKETLDRKEIDELFGIKEEAEENKEEKDTIEQMEEIFSPVWGGSSSDKEPNETSPVLLNKE